MKTWSEAEARMAMDVLNERIARLLHKPVAHPVIRFAPLIDRRQVLTETGSVITKSETLGTCEHQRNRITIVPNEEWKTTAIHELCHYYRPGLSEERIEALTREVAVALKTGAKNVGLNSDDNAALEAWKRGVAGWSKA